MIGPLVAFALLAVAPLAFHSIFLVRFCLAVLGVGILVLFVRPQDRADGRAAARAARHAATARSRCCACRASGRSCSAGGALSLATASDAFIFLALQDELDLGNVAVPAAVRRQLADLHGARRPDGPARRPLRSRPRVRSAATRCCSAVYTAAAVAARRLAAARASAHPARRVLRGDRRRADGARQRGRARATCGRAASRCSAPRRALARLVASIAFGALWAIGGHRHGVRLLRRRARSRPPCSPARRPFRSREPVNA